MRVRRTAAVIGGLVRHSLSPRIFRLLRKKMKRNLNYFAVTIEPGSLASALASARSRPWLGWNVTVPHKVEILPYLDSLDASAAEVGAVNVLSFHDHGCIGYNTDAEAFLVPLRRRGFSIEGRRAVVLGSGGAARAVCSALCRNGIGDISVMSRTAANIDPLVKKFGVRPGVLGDKAVLARIEEADLVVNATPLGMDGQTSPAPEAMSWKKQALAYDLVYRPLETPFLRRAREAGVQTLGGLTMLTAQAAASWRIWFEDEIPESVTAWIEEDLRRELQ